MVCPACWWWCVDLCKTPSKVTKTVSFLGLSQFTGVFHGASLTSIFSFVFSSSPFVLIVYLPPLSWDNTRKHTMLCKWHANEAEGDDNGDDSSTLLRTLYRHIKKRRRRWCKSFKGLLHPKKEKKKLPFVSYFFRDINSRLFCPS